MTRAPLAILVAGVLAACGGRSQAGEVEPEAHVLEVVNRSSSDMDIFVIKAGQRVRRGLAPNNTTTRFSLSTPHFVGVGTAVFEAVPLLPPGKRVSSEPIALGTSGVITIDIPPP